MSAFKFSAEEANEHLRMIDRLVPLIQRKYAAMELSFEEAKDMVNRFDSLADAIELDTFGKESFTVRQAEVLQKEPDEPYMGTFKNPMKPLQTESDEPYMKAYADDQSSAVIHGTSTTNRPLAPGHT